MAASNGSIEYNSQSWGMYIKVDFWYTSMGTPSWARPLSRHRFELIAANNGGEARVLQTDAVNLDCVLLFRVLENVLNKAESMNSSMRRSCDGRHPLLLSAAFQIGAAKMAKGFARLCVDILHAYHEVGRTSHRVLLTCDGGRHRSVATAMALGAFLTWLGAKAVLWISNLRSPGSSHRSRCCTRHCCTGLHQFPCARCEELADSVAYHAATEVMERLSEGPTLHDVQQLIEFCDYGDGGTHA